MAPLYIVFLVQTMGTHGAPVVILPALLLCLFFWKRLPSQEPRKHSASENGAGGFLRNVRDVMGKIWTIVFAVSLRDASYQSIRVFLPMLVILKGGTMESGSLTLFFVTLAGTIAGMIGGKLADTVGDRKILLCSIAVAPFFVLAGLLMSGPFALAVLTVGCALLQASSPVTTAMAQRRCAESRSTASSLAMGVSWGIANLFALPVGASADAIGLEPTLYFVAVVPWVVTTFFLFRHEK